MYVRTCMYYYAQVHGLGLNRREEARPSIQGCYRRRQVEHRKRHARAPTHAFVTMRVHGALHGGNTAVYTKVNLDCVRDYTEDADETAVQEGETRVRE